MILDTLENMKRYAKDMPDLAKIAEIVKKGDWKDGKTVVDDGLYYMVSHYDTHKKGTSGFETHEKYADVQMVLSGKECIDLSTGKLKERKPYSKENDIAFFDGEDSVGCHMVPGLFVVLFPGEAHEPSLDDGAQCSIKKVVFKVLMKK
jgi:biofilm protein TabA